MEKALLVQRYDHTEGTALPRLLEDRLTILARIGN
jgi:hypothetical protein